MIHLLSPVTLEEFNRIHRHRKDRRWRESEKPLQNRLLERVDDWSRLDTCWEWNRALNSRGYGHIRHGGKTCLAHRLAYALWVGPIPEGFQIRHRCDNPRCINPTHLICGTAFDNAQDRWKPAHERKEWRGDTEMAENGADGRVSAR